MQAIAARLRDTVRLDLQEIGSARLGRPADGRFGMRGPGDVVIHREQRHAVLVVQVQHRVGHRDQLGAELVDGAGHRVEGEPVLLAGRID
ncbi:hypothetical protein LCGC14_2120690, partial [marine sediment metagenome]